MPSNMCKKCYRLIPLSATTCSACRQSAPTKARVYKSKPAAGRGYDYQWDKNVKAAIMRQPYCSFCMTKGDKSNPLTGDHKIPISKGGNNTMGNIRVLCRRCNSARGNRD
jgi:5-methylcytosine-specific restriction endonuclease McrA